MQLLSLCLKDSESKYRLEECSKYAWLNGEMSCSIVETLQGLSEGPSRYASYIDLYYQHQFNVFLWYIV